MMRKAIKQTRKAEKAISKALRLLSEVKDLSSKEWLISCITASIDNISTIEHDVWCTERSDI